MVFPNFPQRSLVSALEFFGRWILVHRQARIAPAFKSPKNQLDGAALALPESAYSSLSPQSLGTSI
jgi:hypothetical protein